MATVRRFELHDYGNNSHKFWELHQKDGCYHTEYGRLCGFGRAGSGSRSGQKCGAGYGGAIVSKEKKGYREVSSAPRPNLPSMMSQAPASASVQPRNTPLTVSSKIGLLNWNAL